MTKQELKQYSRLNIELKRLEDKIATLEARLMSPKFQQITDMPRGGATSDTADKIADLVDLKNLYNAKWDKAISEQMKIETAISGLSDPVERALMGYKYIDGMTWEEVCVKINYGWERTHHYHGTALAEIKTV